MTVRILLFAPRKPDITPAQFKDHYETKHVPLLQKIAGSDFPVSHKRLYLARQPVDGGVDGTPLYPAVVFLGDQAQFDFDAIADVSFEDQNHFEAFRAKVEAPEAAKIIGEDEKRFLDWKNVRIVMSDDAMETKRA
ncbi:hypothetical protein N7474_009194 [Penicillium riverlandense]|uniref:uncharacterized protein n=1 Tax=Penicillium riverlandense TaxID=1903569 RepID=UPI002546BF90|nr:uncharacterized protein N7474_009194 [Penicillium riverlandense]KAJ5807925.1 hypothetical protein N7474_009194 [Penicillium riverlandense]